MQQRITKKALLMFFMEIKLMEIKLNNKDIYDINFLLHCNIKFEQSHAKREVLQYSKCQ